MRLAPSRLALAACAAALTLAACGGGGGDDDDDPSEPANITITGVAATGEALDGAAVAVKCAGGTPPSEAVTTGSDGRYSLTVTDGTLPCVIRVTKDGESLHSVVEQGADLPATANVTPLTELLAALVSGGPASGLYDDFDSEAQAQLTAANVSSANENLVASLAGVVDLQGDDLLKGELVAAVDGQGGNLLDQKLDAIARALDESQTTLPELSTAVTAAPGVPPQALAAVPTAAATCPALRSGPFWQVDPANPERTRTAAPSQLNAATLEGISRTSGTDVNYTMTPVSGEACRFTITGTTTDVVISRSAIGMVRSTEEGTAKLSVVFPVQEIALSELAGEWNEAGYVTSSGTMTPFNGEYTIDATGRFTSGQRFIGLAPQAGTPGVRQLVVNPQGGFNVTDNGTLTPARAFAHRAPNGALTLISIPRDGSQGLFIARKREPLTLRAAGTVFEYWDLNVSAGGIGEIISDANEIVATDPTANTETRRRASDKRVDTRLYDNPRTGMAYRAPNSCTTDVGGPPLNCSGSIAIGNAGTGFNSNGGLNSNSFFSLSIIKP